MGKIQRPFSLLKFVVPTADDLVHVDLPGLADLHVVVNVLGTTALDGCIRLEWEISEPLDDLVVILVLLKEQLSHAKLIKIVQHQLLDLIRGDAYALIEVHLHKDAHVSTDFR